MGTQAVATLIAVYGLFMTPLGWGWALFVWGYALAWFLVNDPIKLLAYRVLDATKKAAPKHQGESQARSGRGQSGNGANTAEAKVAEPKPSAATGPQPEVNADNAKADAAEPDATKQQNPPSPKRNPGLSPTPRPTA